jgi:hypothetical protein
MITTFTMFTLILESVTEFSEYYPRVIKNNLRN